MVDWIVVSALRLRILVVAFAAVLLAAGIWQVRDMPLDIVPEFSPVSLEVKTEALGLSPAEVESLITVPLEADLLNGVPWLQSIQSESISGLSSIEMFFVPGTDLMHARQMVDERLTQARALPNVSSPPTMLQPVSSASRIMNIGLTSKSVSLIDMSVQARWDIAPRLLGVPGVANVAIWGQRDRQLQVLVNPATLHAKGVTVDQIVKTAGEAVWESPLTYLESSTPGTGGFVDTPNQRLGVRHIQPILSPAEFASVPVSGTSLALGEVATVVESHQPLIGDAVFKDGPGLMLVVEKFPGFTTLQVTRGVEAALAELKAGMTGIDVSTAIYRPASFIERAAGNLSKALLIAAALVVGALIFLLGSWRAALVAILSIALSLVAAGLVLHLRGVNIDIMVVAGLLMATGVIVGDAVLDVENVARRLRQSREESAYITAGSVIVRAAKEMRGPMLYATLIVVIAVMPGLFIHGLSAGFFRPLIWTYVVAVLASMLVALIVTPALTALLMSKAPLPAGGGMVNTGLWRRLEEKVLMPAVRSPATVYAAAAAAVVVGLFVWSLLGRSALPTFKETDVVVELQGAPGTSLQAMERITSGLIHDVVAIPGVRDAAGHIGRAALSREVADVDAAELSVSIDPGANYGRTLAAIKAVIRSYPGISGSVEAYLSSKMREALTGEDETVTVRVYGQDPDIIAAKAEEIRKMLAKVDGITDPRVESQTRTPTVEIEVDLARAGRYGLKPGDVRRATSALVSGITVGALFQDQRVFDVVVWGAPEIRDNLSKLQNLLIDTESGEQVRLADVATVRTAPSLSVIRRQGVSRRIDVDADVSGRPLAEVARDVGERLRDVAFPFEYHAEVLGESVEHQAAIGSIFSYVAAAAIMIFLLLQAALGSWRLALASIIGMPMAAVGALVGAALAGGVFSLGSLVGLVIVLGVTARNGVSLAMHLRAADGLDDGRSRADIVLGGVREKAPSIVAAAVVTGLVFLPFILLAGAGGLELATPAAAVVIAGLVTSTLVTLVVVPSLYMRFGARSAAERDEDGTVGDARLGRTGNGLPARA